MTTVYVGIGSNLGDKLGHCVRAFDLMNGLAGCKVQRRSRYYRTEPVGNEKQDWFVNAATSLSCELSPMRLLRNLLAIETSMGRTRNEKWGPRIIDLDLLLYGCEVIKEKNLKVPHPLMHLRRFVLVPMVELAPKLVHPVLGKTMVDLMKRLPEKGQGVIPLGEA